MKKLNLKFFGRGAKMVLPLFLLVGLFLISATNASAQYVPESEAMGILKGHIDSFQNATLALRHNQDMLTPEQSARNTDYYKQMFGEVVLHFIMDQDYTVSKAINKAVEMAEYKQFPKESINIIKQEYIDLLTD